MQNKGYRSFHFNHPGTRQAAASLVLLAVFLLAGCALLNTGQGPVLVSAEDQVRTAAAKTVAAWGTVGVLGGSPTPVRPTVTLTPTLTLTPTVTLTPNLTSTRTSGEPCNQASYVQDVTIPDDAMLIPNTVFIKTWEIKNTGSCAWNSSYAVVFAGRGNAMSGTAATPILQSGSVNPGDTFRVSVVMRAPNEPGTYEGYWQLRDGNNQTFGVGKNGGAPFYVRINVGDRYSFAEHICSAKWSTSAGELPCPGAVEGSQGYMIRQVNPTLEDNAQYEGLGLLVAPPPTGDGYIVARFPAVMVPNDSDFRAVLGCQPGVSGCYVRFRVTYQLNGEPEQLLGEWNEGHEGGVTVAIKDLDPLYGRAAAFSLYVYVNGTPDQARAIWFDPRITK